MGDSSLTIDDLAPSPRNPREITDEAAEGLRLSVARFGDIGGITFNRRTGRLVAGHQRVAQLRALGAQMVGGALQLASGHRFTVRVVDWSEAEEKAANVTANNPHIAGSFTAELDALLGEVEGSIGQVEFEGLRLDELLNSIATNEDDAEDENPYTEKADSVTYELKGERPSARELYDAQKTEKLLAGIEEYKELPTDVRHFLQAAAMRHTVFDYQSIAEFYAHASGDIQKLMEASALVIIDINQAIEQGFVTLTAKLAAAYEANRDS